MQNGSDVQVFMASFIACLEILLRLLWVPDNL